MSRKKINISYENRKRKVDEETDTSINWDDGAILKACSSEITKPGLKIVKNQTKVIFFDSVSNLYDIADETNFQKNENNFIVPATSDGGDLYHSWLVHKLLVAGQSYNFYNEDTISSGKLEKIDFDRSNTNDWSKYTLTFSLSSEGEIVDGVSLDQVVPPVSEQLKSFFLQTTFAEYTDDLQLHDCEAFDQSFLKSLKSNLELFLKNTLDENDSEAVKNYKLYYISGFIAGYASKLE